MAAALLAAGCGSSSSGDATSATVDSSLGTHKARLVVVGDIVCAPLGPVGDRCHQASTYALAAKIKPDHVLVLGDTQYPNGALRLYRRSYAATWGKLRSITFPVPGNHEYKTGGATGYFDYCGAAAGHRKQGWHASTIGGWRVIGLNSQCGEVGGCGTGSAQAKWLKGELANHATNCTLAIWHFPRFSSGPHRNHPSMSVLWSELEKSKADVVFSGHDHEYERLAAMTNDGKLSDSGIPSFVVGTGGVERYPTFKAGHGSLAHNRGYGVLQLDLYTRGYRWAYVQTDGKVADSGQAACR